MMQEIQYKQKLYRKLCTSPTYYHNDDYPKEMVSAQFLNLIIRQHFEKSSIYQWNLLCEIMTYFQMQPMNSLHIYHHDCINHGEDNKILDNLILWAYQLIDSTQQIEHFLHLLPNLLAYYHIGVSNITVLTKKIAKSFFQGKFNHVSLEFIHRVLGKYYQRKQGLLKNRFHFFYFYGYHAKSGIYYQNSHQTQLILKNEFSITFCFQVIYDRKEELCSLKNTHDQIKIILCNHQFEIFNQNNDKRIVIDKKIWKNKWYRILINFTFNQTIVYIDDQKICKKGVLNDHKQCICEQIIFGGDLHGFLSSIIIWNEVIDNRKFSIKQFPHGLLDWNQVIVFEKFNLHHSVALCCLPLSLYEQKFTQYCWNIFNKKHAILEQNVIAFQHHWPEYEINYLGGINIILPMFFTSRFYQATKYPKLLDNLLQLIIILMDNYTSQEFQKQHNQSFFLILGGHISYLASFITINTFKLLNQISNKLHHNSTKIKFLRMVMWRIKISEISSQQLVNGYFNSLIRKYQNNFSIAFSSAQLKDVMYWCIHSLQQKNNYCCSQHYINENIFNPELNNIHNINLKMHYYYITVIASIILEHNLIDSMVKCKNVLIFLLGLLLNTHSTCFYLLILRIIRKQVNKFREKNQQYVEILIQCDLLSYLNFLSQKIISCDIVTQIIILLLYAYNFNRNNTQIIYLICHILQRQHSLLRKSSQLIRQKVKKIRKRSVNSFDINYQSQKWNTLLQKPLNRVNNWQELFNILMNFLDGLISELNVEYNKNSYIHSEQALILLIQYSKFSSLAYRKKTAKLLKKITIVNSNSLNLYYNSITYNSLIIILYQKGQKQIRNDCICMISNLMYFLLKQKKSCLAQYILIKALSELNNQQFSQLLSKIFENIFDNNALNLQEYIQLFMVLQFQKVDHGTFEENLIRTQQILIIKINDFIKNWLINILEIHHLSWKKFPCHVLLRHKLSKHPSILYNCLFQDTFQSLALQQITFLFDIILSKLIMQVPIPQILQMDLNKNIYTLELYLQYIRYNLDLNIVPQLLQAMVDTILIFVIICLFKGKQFELRSLFYMVIFQNSTYLLNKNSEDCHQAFVDIWTIIIQITCYLASQLQNNKFEALAINMQKQCLNPIICQLWEQFIKNQEHKPLITLADLKKIQSLSKFIRNNQFEQAIFINKSILFVNQFCQQKHHIHIKVNLIQQMTQINDRISLKQSTYSAKNHTTSFQKIFDGYNIQEDSRWLKFLSEKQTIFRKYHQTWKKMWAQFRIYHQPYSLCMAQNNHSFDYQQIKIDKTFKFITSPYFSKGGLQPILKAKIIQPWHIIKNHQQIKQIKLLAEMTKPVLNVSRKVKNRPILTKIWDYMWNGKIQRTTVTVEYEILWIKQIRKAKGRLLIDDDKIIRQEDSHVSFEEFALPYYQETYKIWRIDFLLKVARRRYLMKYNALELFFLNSKSVLFEFEPTKSDQFLKQLDDVRQKKIKDNFMKIKMNKVSIYMDGWFNEKGLQSAITELWKQHKISNLSYLIQINQSASRNCHDLSQYMVVPWVVKMKNQIQPTSRDLIFTLGALGSPDRRQFLQEKYKSKDPFNPIPAFFYGTHYSSPGVVFNFLIRLSPFTEYCKKLQGGKFDIPDRLFSSLINCWRSADNEVSDVRELIPQFYYLPEFLLNLQGHNFGVTQNKEKINHVELPLWASNNPYYFIKQMRQIIESKEVSQNISSWIDLVFGYKQSGKQAEDAINIYYYLTYEDYTHVYENSQDQIYRKSCQAQIVHFGQIPPQLFNKPHPTRNYIHYYHLEIDIVNKWKLNYSAQCKLLAVKVCSHQFKFINKNSVQTISINKNLLTYHKKIPLNLEISRRTSKIIVDNKYSMLYKNSRCFFIGNLFFLSYGYITNQFRIYSLSSGSIIDGDILEEKIGYILLNNDQNMLLVGSLSGFLYVYEIQYTNNKHDLKIRSIHTQIFLYSIIHISQWDGFYAICFGNYVAIYKIQRSLSFLLKENNQKGFIKFIRSFKNNIPVKLAFIINSPLYSLVIIDNAYIKVYSINGQFMNSITCSAQYFDRINSPNLHNFIFLAQDDKITFLSIPELRSVSQIQMPGLEQIFGKCIISRDQIWIFDCL